jgi:DNA-binding GntR family transcriptional regulator
MPTSRVNHADRVYSELLTRIVRGNLAPGSRIIERDIAERLGVSRTPVRAAIRRLQAEGFVESLEGSKYERPVVASLSEEDARDYHDFVMALESVVARRVAGLTQDVRERVAEHMSARNREFRALGERAPLDPAAILEADHAVHAAYIEAGAGPRLLSLRAAVKPQLERYALNYGSAFPQMVPQAALEHEAIARAIADGDVERAGAAVIRNWENSASRLRDAITASGDRGGW